MRDPVRVLAKAFTELGRAIWDAILIDLEKLRYYVDNRVFWAGTFMLIALVLMNSCLRRGV